MICIHERITVAHCHGNKYSVEFVSTRVDLFYKWVGTALALGCVPGDAPVYFAPSPRSGTFERPINVNRDP